MRERLDLSRFFFMRLGFFGGTFNPVHNGHLALANRAMEFLELDRLWWIPANPWQKDHSDLIASKDRIAMIKLAIDNNKKMAVDTRELDRAGLSYSIDTVKELAHDFPNDQRFYLIGSDQWKNFHTWKYWQTLFDYVTLVIVIRNGIWEEPDNEVIDFVRSNHITILKMPMPAIDIDSSRIRALLPDFSANRNILKAKLPPAVFNYLKTKQEPKTDKIFPTT